MGPSTIKPPGMESKSPDVALLQQTAAATPQQPGPQRSARMVSSMTEDAFPHQAGQPERRAEKSPNPAAVV